MEKTRGSHVSDGNVFQLLLHGKWPLFQPTGNINNHRRPLKQAGLRGNDAPPAQPPSAFILGQNLRPLIILGTSATRNPPATHQRPPTRDWSSDETLTLLADGKTERHPQPKAGDTDDSAAGTMADARHRGVTKTRIVTPERRTAAVTSISRLNSKEGQKLQRGDPPSSSGMISESAEKKILHSESQSNLKVPSTKLRKNDGLWTKHQHLGQRKKTPHHTNVFISNIVSTVAFVNFEISFLSLLPLPRLKKKKVINAVLMCSCKP